jgi:dynein heavy chain
VACRAACVGQQTSTIYAHTQGQVLSDGTRDDPVLARFEEAIARYKGVAAEIAALPATQTLGWVKINAKPLRTALSTWASK